MVDYMESSITYISKNNTSSDLEFFIFVGSDDIYGYSLQVNYLLKNHTLRCTVVKLPAIINKKRVAYNFMLWRYTMDSFEQTKIKGEDESFSNDDLFNINSWGADLSFRELIAMYDEKDLIKPNLQRKYVWTLEEASRLIDSILLGLPIPSVFLAKKEEQKLIIDGYQRIKTVYDFVKGTFAKTGRPFKLSKSTIINARWRGKTFSELAEDEQRRVRNTTIHAIIFEQKKPNNDSGMYQIFERINTSGRTLYPQEIRNCIYQGNYNNLLMQLNKNETWRTILNCSEDARMADVENILRYFAIKNLVNTDDYDKNQIVLKKFLNENMALNCYLSEKECEEYAEEFISTLDTIYKYLGTTAFNNVVEKKDSNGNIMYSDQFVKKFHPTIYEATMLSFRFAMDKGLNFENLKEKQLQLLNDLEFKEATTIRTTNIDNIKKRVSLATKYFFGVEYEWK